MWWWSKHSRKDLDYITLNIQIIVNSYNTEIYEFIDYLELKRFVLSLLVF